jgi:hypothetical protein
VNAVLALALNTIILIAALSYFGATTCQHRRRYPDDRYGRR